MAHVAVGSIDAHAQPTGPDTSKKQTAKSYVDAGLQAQKTGDYDTAIILYEKAYDLLPHPVLLFNMAQAHRLAGRLNRAAKLYRKYLHVAPRGSEAHTARELLVELEAQQRRAAQDHAADDDVPPDPEGDHPPKLTSGTADTTDSGVLADDAKPASGEATETGSIVPDHSANSEPHGRSDFPMPLARIALGPAVVHRSLSFTVRSGFAEGAPDLATTAMEARIEGELYPFALTGDDNAFAGLGLAARYERAFGLSVVATPLPDQHSVDQSDYSVGLRYRFVPSTDMMLALGADYIHRQYVIDQPAIPPTIDVPSVAYAAVAPTIVVRARLGESVALVAAVDGLLTLDAGPIQNASSYGKATIYGVTGSAGIEFAVTDSIGVHVLIELDRFSLTFDGNGAMASARDGDRTTQDVAGATDQSISAAATLGVTY